MKTSTIILMIVLSTGMQAAASAELGKNESRGAMLYGTHCNTCHTSEIHWRDKRLVKDWRSLEYQVRRWQGTAGLEWSDDEIDDVVRYLNSQYYHFKPAGGRDISLGN